VGTLAKLGKIWTALLWRELEASMSGLMRSTLALALAAALAAATSVLSPASAQDESDQRLGAVHFTTSCNEVAQRRFDRAMRYQHSFWYRQAKEIFEDAAKGDPECGMA
jgi:Tfp pilus assembly protein PilF